MKLCSPRLFATGVVLLTTAKDAAARSNRMPGVASISAWVPCAPWTRKSYAIKGDLGGRPMDSRNDRRIHPVTCSRKGQQTPTKHGRFLSKTDADNQVPTPRFLDHSLRVVPKGHRPPPILSTILATLFFLASPFTIANSAVSLEQQNLPFRLESFPSVVRSEAQALTEEQLLVDEVWKEVTRQYVDRTFNGLGEEGWRQQRLTTVMQVGKLGPDETEAVYGAIRQMISRLGDPYTRFLTPDQYESLTSYARGGSVTNAQAGGIGVQLLGDPTTGKMVIFNTLPDSPASRGGMKPGDLLLQVDNEDVDGATAEVIAARCRGEIGTEVSLTVQHRGEDGGLDKPFQISLTRSKIQSTSTVESSIFVSDQKKKVGLIRVASFNLETERLVREALDEVRSKIPKGGPVVLDLRGNVGGYMPAGVDVAKLFLPPRARVISEVDSKGRATIYINDGVGSDTTMPLYLLVDERTASASEILTAALQDNHRATVVAGSSKTFGKGRIQNLQALSDGSGIAVTKAKYITPDGRDIHGIGITPDMQSKTCGSKDLAATCLEGIL